MPDMLRVTQPITTNDNNIGRSHPQDRAPQTTIANIPDPTRVTKTADQTVYSERQNQRHDPNVKSNFDHFVGLLRSTPHLSQTITQLIFTRMGNVVNSGISEDFAANIAKFMDLLNMNEAELLQFVLTQAKTSAKFSGEIFDMLRQVVGGSNSSDMTNAILEFVRTFDNASSNGQLINSIISNLNNIAQYMPKSKGDELLALVSKLIPSAEQQGSNPANMETLKTEIFPYLSKYISQTKDFGTIRDIISTLTLNYVNYENGSVDNLMQAFKKLFNYPQLGERLSQIPAEEIEAMLLNSKYKSADTQLMDLFVNIIANGLQGGSDATNKELFENVLKSLLINNSVYMPVEHMIVPVFIGGRHMFSEIWVDPDANNGADENDEKTAKLLVKFDIENIGFFELVMLYRCGEAEMLMFCPPALSKKYDDIKSALQKILENNGISCLNIAVEKSLQPLVISDVFPKIFEKRDSINVTV